MAPLPGAAAGLPGDADVEPADLPRGGSSSGVDERAGGGLFREGVRGDVPGPAAGGGGGEGPRVPLGDAGPAGVPGLDLRGPGPVPRLRARGAARRGRVAARSAAGAGDGTRGVRDRARPGTLRSPDPGPGGARGAAGGGAGGCVVTPRRVSGEARTDLGLRRRAERADGVHGDRVLEAADDDLQRNLPAHARSTNGGRGVLPAGGEVPG